MKKKNGVVCCPKSDVDWQAEDDARTLANAEMIKADPKRLKPAIKEAKKLAAKKMQEAKGLKNVCHEKKYLEERSEKQNYKDSFDKDEVNMRGAMIR